LSTSAEIKGNARPSRHIRLRYTIFFANVRRDESLQVSKAFGGGRSAKQAAEHIQKCMSTARQAVRAQQQHCQQHQWHRQQHQDQHQPLQSLSLQPVPSQQQQQHQPHPQQHQDQHQPLQSLSLQPVPSQKQQQHQPHPQQHQDQHQPLQSRSLQPVPLHPQQDHQMLGQQHQPLRLKAPTALCVMLHRPVDLLSAFLMQQVAM
jgi:hypothetical protein